MSNGLSTVLQTALLASGSESAGNADVVAPAIIFVLPFVGLLIAIAIFPLLPNLSHWWEKNRNKLIVSLALTVPVVIYYGLRVGGFAGSTAGFSSVLSLLEHAVLGDDIPFMRLFLAST